MRKYYNFIFIFFSIFISDNSDKINGKYFSIIDIRRNSSLKDNFEITFLDSTYVKSYANGEIIYGKISTYNNSEKIILEDHQVQIVPDEDLAIPWSPEVMELLEYDCDTIKFKTRPKNNLHITRLTGKLIRKN